MAEGTYEDELMRAELLGIDPPDRAVFEANQQERMAAQQEEIDQEQAKELDAQDEKLQTGSGKLDDLNQILNITQMKLNKFKGVCGSLTNLLRIKSDSKNNSTDNISSSGVEAMPSSSAKDPDLPLYADAVTGSEQMQADAKLPTREQVEASKFDLSKKLTSNLDKLDTLIHKAERAEISLQEQNKQAKGFLG